MKKLVFLAVCLFPLTQVVPLISPNEGADRAQEDTQRFGSRAYWLLNPWHYAKLNREGKSRLEACVARIGLARELRLRPTASGHMVEIEIVNHLNSPISGLIVQPQDSRLAALDLDSPTAITFQPIQPGEKFVYRETVSDMKDLFPREVSFKLTAHDVVNEHGLEVVEHIFWSHWPLVSSEEDLTAVEQALCGTTSDEPNTD